MDKYYYVDDEQVTSSDFNSLLYEQTIGESERNFDSYLDENFGSITIDGITYPASEVVYNLDLPYYQELLSDFTQDRFSGIKNELNGGEEILVLNTWFKVSDEPINPEEVNLYGEDESLDPETEDKPFEPTGGLTGLNTESLLAVKEAVMPKNIAEFAKRKGVLPEVRTICSWAEKVGAHVGGGTAIGKNYDTLILDLTYQGGEIYFDINSEEIRLFEEPVKSFIDFKRVYQANKPAVAEETFTPVTEADDPIEPSDLDSLLVTGNNGKQFRILCISPDGNEWVAWKNTTNDKGQIVEDDFFSFEGDAEGLIKYIKELLFNKEIGHTQYAQLKTFIRDIS